MTYLIIKGETDSGSTSSKSISVGDDSVTTSNAKNLALAYLAMTTLTGTMVVIREDQDIDLTT